MKKIMIVLWASLFFSVVLTGCSKKTHIEKVIDKCESEFKNKRDSGLGGVIQNALKFANASSSQYGYSFAAQMQAVNGDVKGSLKNLEKAIAIKPESAEPHYILARVYYKLAIFDMVNRGFCTLDFIPFDKFPLSILQRGHLKIELREIMVSECITFKNFLKKYSIYGKEWVRITLFILWVDREKIMGEDAPEFIDQEMKEMGMPKRIPVLVFKPDDLSKEILRIVRSELELGDKGSPIKNIPQGVQLVDPTTTKSLKARVNSLLSN